MSRRFRHTFWRMTAMLVFSLVSLTGCNLFGRNEPQPTPTEIVLPTETPLPALPTYTPTPTQPPPTPTATATAVVGATAVPTLTPTATSQPPVGGEQPAPIRTPARVVRVVTRVPVVGDALENGSFEGGFGEQGIAREWGGFDNEGAVYAWVDELQPVHVTHGDHAQLMRIMGPGQPDRYVGIYQTVDVVAGATYTLTMHGIVRSSTAGNDATPYGHRMQWAIDGGGGSDWRQVKDWTDTGWNDVPLDDEDAAMNPYVIQIEAPSDALTLYIRGWTKWPILGSEAKFYVDGVSLQGPIPGQEEEVTVVVSNGGSGSEEMPTTGSSGAWLPIAGTLLIAGFAFWEIRKRWAK